MKKILSLSTLLVLVGVGIAAAQFPSVHGEELRLTSSSSSSVFHVLQIRDPRLVDFSQVS
jgi:hypothetical protein